MVFTPQEHWVMVDVLSDTRAVLTAIGRNGETLDRFVVDREDGPPAVPGAPAQDTSPADAP